MGSRIVVTGLPSDTTFTKNMYTFRAMFNKIQIKNFWIQDLSKMQGADEKQMTIDFVNDSDARKAYNYLHNYRFKHFSSKEVFTLSAYIGDSVGEFISGEGNRGDRSRRPSKKKRERARAQARPKSPSPSPGYQSEASKLDLEIELLRKQRQVIEEERRLLLERQKLDMMREYGSSGSRDFMDYDELKPPRKRRQPPAPTEVKKPRNHSPPPPRFTASKTTNILPGFVLPCKKLIAEMRDIIEQDTTPEESEILIKLIRAAIRKNLAIALEGKEYMRGKQIVKLYRELHPKTGDEAFIKKILANIRASYLPDELELKLASIKKEPKNGEGQSVEKKTDKDETSLGIPSDDNKVGDDKDKREVRETESQDKLNGGNKTDAGQEDFTVDVIVDDFEKTNETKDVITTDEPTTTVKETTEAKGDVATDYPKTDETAEVQKIEDDTVEETTEDKGDVATDDPKTDETAEVQKIEDDTVEENTEVKGDVATDDPKTDESAEVQKIEDGETEVPAAQS